MIAVGSLLAALVIAVGGDDAPLLTAALAGLSLAWLVGLGILLNRPLFVAQSATRSYRYRSGRWPWQPSIAGSLDRDVEELRLAPKPCGRRRACAAGYGLWIVLRRPAVAVLLGDWPSLADAEADALTRARRWRVALRDATGHLLYPGGDGDA